jgi:hypothetical protein
MRYPSFRLTSIGDGYDQVTLYPTDYLPDIEGNPVKTPHPGLLYPAIVTRQSATMSQTPGSVESTTAYQILVYCRDDPGVLVGDPVDWLGKDLVAQGNASSSGPGAWSFAAIEVDPDPDGDGPPFNLQPT